MSASWLLLSTASSAGDYACSSTGDAPSASDSATTTLSFHMSQSLLSSLHTKVLQSATSSAASTTYASNASDATYESMSTVLCSYLLSRATSADDDATSSNDDATP